MSKHFMRHIISEREGELPTRVIGKLLKIAEENKKTISLGPGEPDFTSPNNIIRAAKKYLDKGYTHYSPPVGVSELKELIIKKLKKENKISAGLENVVVTTGATEGILLGLMCTIDPGEGVIISDPSFLAYKPSVEVLNGMPISVPLLEEDKFQLNINKMKELIVPEKTNAIIINTPQNPTGTILKRKTLEEIANFANEYDLLVISDEAYEKFVYEGRHVSIGSLNGMEERVLSLFSFSKTYAMPGFRVGFGIGPEKLIKAMGKLKVFTTLCTPTISQMAAIEALKGPQKSISVMLKEYDRRRKHVIKRINEINLPCVRPEGAFYSFPNITEFKMKSSRFTEKLLKEAKVSVVPGTEFGRHGEGFIRLSYATDYNKIKIAMNKIERFVGKFRKK